MIRLVVVFLIGAAIMSAVGVAFYLSVGDGLPLSKTGQNWGIFGDYFGGVAGTLLSFLNVLLIVYTIHQQSAQIASDRDESLKRDLLQYVSKADEEIELWLHKKIAAKTDGQLVEIGDVVWGLVPPNDASHRELAIALDRLLKLTCTYCASIGLYKDNIKTRFIFRQHRQKAEELVSFLEGHKDKLSQTEGASLDFCKAHLHGKSEA